MGKYWKSRAEGIVWPQLIEHNILQCCSTPLVRRSCFDTVGNFDLSISETTACTEDWEMWLRIAARYPFQAIAAPLTYYRVHSNNASRNWQQMEQDSRIILERAFETAPPEFQYLKPRAEAFSMLRLAWKALQNLDGDDQVAQEFRKQALLRYPPICYSLRYIRLSLAIWLVRLLGPNGYDQLQLTLYRWKERVLHLPATLLKPTP